jgi:DNA-binding transcriptional LysR family regulator
MVGGSGVDLAELETFVQIVERGSLSAAARATRQSLPTVSRHLRALEVELDAPLAHRTTRRLVVTEAGQQLYQHARRALSELAQAKSRAGVRAVERLVVSMGVTLGQHLFVPRLPALLKQRPGLRLEVRLEDRLTELLIENVDVVIRAGIAPPDSAELVAHRLVTFHRSVVAAPSVVRASGSPVAPSALAGQPCLVQTGALGVLDRWRLAKGEREEVVDVSGRLVATSPQVLLQAACAGVGYAFLPTWLTEDAVREKRLVRLLKGWEGPAVSAYAVYRTRLRGSPAIRAFVEAMTYA